MQADLAPRLPLEVLYSVGDINPIAIDARIFETAVQELSRGPNEWVSGKIFFVARLLANHHDCGMRTTRVFAFDFAHNCLGGAQIKIAASAVLHSFWIPALNGKVDLIPGQPNFIRLVASQPGVYTGQCAEYCGEEHALMRLMAVVQEPSAYRAWIANQLKPGVQPESPEAKAGEQILVSSPCATCHTVRGTTAGGRVAPA